ncbi:tyrosine-type recombinase/integrase [Chloroflexota bacterium]
MSLETVANYTRAIKSFFSFLAREELLPENPMRKVRSPKAPRKVMPTFTEAELERLLSQPNKKSPLGFRDYTFMLTLVDTGIRLSELRGLCLGDVDLANGYLRVMGKGGKERYVPIGAKLSKVLLKYQMLHRTRDSGCQSFFLTRDGRLISQKKVQELIRKYGERAGIRKRCSPHTFRSTSAVLYLRNGGDPFSLQKKLGHSSLAMTRRYSELADSDVRAAHLKYSPADRLRA